MSSFTDSYTIQQKIYEGHRSIIYLAKNKDSKTCVIKTLKEDFINPRQNAILKHEYNILQKIHSQHVIKSIELVNYNNQLAIIEEDIGGVSLLQILKQKTLNLKDILHIAISLAEGIGDIHSRFIIHKDIKPQNIIVNPQTLEVKIIDFGISTILSRETQEAFNPEGLEGSVAYISPEQTGRMNRAVDYRTDIYSLGVTLYELLSNRLPFQSQDLMGLLHMHIAQLPPMLHQVDNTIPEPISLIISKCLEKDPEERYHSGYGLKNDLQECLIQLQEKERIDFFLPGKKDVYDRFQIPQKLYGREKEVETLTNQLKNIHKESTLLLVSGYSGIGKSSVVNEVQKTIAHSKGFFISGKYEQYKKEIPFSAFIQAFQILIQFILTENETQLAKWKANILNEIEENGQLIIDLIPEVELIIGKQPDVGKIDFSEAENRFLHVMLCFIKVFLSEESPLVIFLDDLQWADYSSLKLISTLIREPSIKYIAIIGAYRDNEVGSSHPLAEMLNQVVKEGKTFEKLKIGPLDLASINDLVSDIIHTDQNEAYPLASIVYKKTLGNPFFVNRFLSHLYHEGHLKFNTGLQKMGVQLKSYTKPRDFRKCCRPSGSYSSKIVR